MSAKTSPARRAAFLKTLAETGNHTIAAAHARVSRSWVTLHKTNDPDFRAACDAAVARRRGKRGPRCPNGRRSRCRMEPRRPCWIKPVEPVPSVVRFSSAGAM